MSNMNDDDNNNKNTLRKRRKLPEEEEDDDDQTTATTIGQQRHWTGNVKTAAATAVQSLQATESRSAEAAKQLLCGGVAGSVAKTVTAPFSRLTILFQVHSLVTTKHNRPKFAMSLKGGVRKIIERGGFLSMWRGNMTSVLHRFPYSALNFYIYENTLDFLSGTRVQESDSMTQKQLVRRVSKIVLHEVDDDDDDDYYDDDENDYNNNDYDYNGSSTTTSMNNNNNNNASSSSIGGSRGSTSKRQRKRKTRDRSEDTPAKHKFMAGAMAGSIACLCCYPLDLVRTRLTTELEGMEHYRGIVDAFQKITKAEGLTGFYSGVGPTLLVAVPNFAISYTVYGTLKEYTLDDELFYNLRRIDSDSGETKLGFGLTILCGACSGILATLITFPMDTIRRRMQIQNLHVPIISDRLSSQQQFAHLVTKEGLGSLYRGLTPELLKVVPMVGTMFVVYEWTKDLLNVRHDRR